MAVGRREKGKKQSWVTGLEQKKTVVLKIKERKRFGGSKGMLNFQTITEHSNVQCRRLTTSK